MKSPSSDDKIKALKREIALRKRAYPMLIRIRKMSQAAADHEIAVMQAILEDYETILKDPDEHADLYGL